MANLYEPRWDVEHDAPPFRWRRARLGNQAGARDLGASLFELPPGAESFPLHAHLHNEELLVVVAGRPTLRTADGQRELAPGDVVAFPPGADTPHTFLNASDAAVRVLVVSTMRAPEVNVFPDTGEVWARDYVPGEPAPEGAFDVRAPLR